MNLEIIDDQEYLKKQLFKTPAKILLNSISGYYFLTEDRARNYFEHVIGMISLQCPNKPIPDICTSLINKYSSRLEIYKSQGEKKEKISMILLCLFILAVVVTIAVLITLYYRSYTTILFSLLLCTYLSLYFVVKNSLYNDKKAQVLESILSSLKQSVDSYACTKVQSKQVVAENNILSILKFMSDNGCVKLKFCINSYTYNSVTNLVTLKMTSIVRILRILENHKVLEFDKEMNVKEFSQTFASYFTINSDAIKANSLETTFNNLTYDETRAYLSKIDKVYHDVLVNLFKIN